MSTSFLPGVDATRESVEKLFADKSPVLVEVLFPKMGTSSDWFLCDDVTEFDSVLERLASGTEIHLTSVWDVKRSGGTLVIRK